MSQPVAMLVAAAGTIDLWAACCESSICAGCNPARRDLGLQDAAANPGVPGGYMVSQEQRCFECRALLP